MEKASTVYIAGPMRRIKRFNFPAFDAARDTLEVLGFAVISPADLDRANGFDETAFPDDYDWVDLGSIGFSLHSAIDRDVAALKKCNAIYMLNGWETSKGATAEKALAEWMGLCVMYQSDTGSLNPEDILEEALRITRGDRNASYGPPDQDFRRTAAMWSANFEQLLREGIVFEPEHVAQAMILLKLSRLQHSRTRDSVVDLAGYARCMDVCYRHNGGYAS